MQILVKSGQNPRESRRKRRRKDWRNHRHERACGEDVGWGPRHPRTAKPVHMLWQIVIYSRSPALTYPLTLVLPYSPCLSRKVLPPFLSVYTCQYQLTKVDSHPSSAAFDVINQTLQANEADRKNALSQAKAIFAFNLKNSSGEEAAWYLDLKNKGEVGQGAAPAGSKADGESTFSIYVLMFHVLYIQMLISLLQ